MTDPTAAMRPAYDLVDENLDDMRLRRPTLSEPDALLGLPIPVLDHGFVRLIDYMGSDAAVVQAARVSYGPGTRNLRDDSALIAYLMRNRHTSPFEMVELKLHIRAPIFVERQWVRHRTASWNGQSQRYTHIDAEPHIPELEALRLQSAANKQGRADIVTGLPLASDGTAQATEWQHVIAGATAGTKAIYNEFVAGSMAREMARIFLPLTTYTEWYWKIDLHNLFHFLRLRLDPHAQEEIRLYASAVASFVMLVAPTSWDAFREYQLEARTASATVRRLVALLAHSLTYANDQTVRAVDAAEYADLWLSLTAREREELAADFDLPPSLVTVSS